MYLPGPWLKTKLKVYCIITEKTDYRFFEGIIWMKLLKAWSESPTRGQSLIRSHRCVNTLISYAVRQDLQASKLYAYMPAANVIYFCKAESF